ncbi:hypothetical protein [Alkalilimnicola ehrlichii]|nr:hypothetical protein [Alkalilimnicola ehrlichii]
MALTDANLLAALSETFAAGSGRKRLLYTGGGWLYGNSRRVLDETAPYDPPPEWRWAAEAAQRVVRLDGVEACVVHPANVVDAGVGAPPILLEDAQETGRVRLPVARDATWPLVEQSALAVLYALVLEKGLPGEVI